MTNIKNSVFKEILRDYLSELDAEIKALEKLRDDYARTHTSEGLIDPITEISFKVSKLKRIVS